MRNIMKMVIIYLKNKLTVFQKDKTVMFSREEATDTIMASRDGGLKSPLKKEVELPGRANEDDLFELASPMPMEEELHKTQNYKPALHNNHDNDEEIFNLGDDNMFGGDQDFLDIPEANLKDELGENHVEEPKRVESKHRVFEVEPVDPNSITPIPTIPTIGNKKSNEKPMYTPPPVTMDNVDNVYNVDNVDKVIEVPLNIQIPEDKDEIRINFNLQLVIKRK